MMKPEAKSSENIKNIPYDHEFLLVKPIDKGWSDDSKYYIETANGEKLLLRSADISCYQRKKQEFEAMKLVARQGIPMSQPIDFGVYNDEKMVYTLLSWAEGEDAELVIPDLSKEKQYQLGLSAGELLANIHSIPAPVEQEPWGLHYNRKLDMKIVKYKSCGLRFTGDTDVLNYIKQSRYLVEDRPQCFHHGDYHVGNMIMKPSGQLTVIDFNRFDYGDPWQEFNRIVWCASISKYFASGRINGYFSNNVPEDFFRLLALYISSNILSSIYWAISFGQAEINTMLKQANDILLWYDGMTKLIPEWYRQEI